MNFQSLSSQSSNFLLTFPVLRYALYLEGMMERAFAYIMVFGVLLMIECGMSDIDSGLVSLEVLLIIVDVLFLNA